MDRSYPLTIKHVAYQHDFDNISLMFGLKLKNLEVHCISKL